MFRLIDITGDGIITRREFVLFFINVFCSRNHFSESENEGAPRVFTINERQINEIYQNIDNILSGMNVGAGVSRVADEGRVKLEMNKNQSDTSGTIPAGPQYQTNADAQLGYQEFDKLITDQDAYQFLTIDFY